MFADLHLHTTASDGINTPAEVVKLAKGKGFSAIAITDHDTTGGLEEALKAGAAYGIEVIPGIELSTLEGEREIHILGFYSDPECSALQKMLSQMIEARSTRALKMVEKLQETGIDIDIERVKEIAGGKFIGRPHIARAMLESGYINDLSEAFSEELIGRGGRGYVERFKLSPKEGINILKKAQAIPVLAHPGFLSKGEPVKKEEIAALTAAGLQGLEVYYSKHTPAQNEFYLCCAQEYSLLVTGGSDCHGQPDQTNSLGIIKLPYKYVEALKNERARQMAEDKSK